VSIINARNEQVGGSSFKPPQLSADEEQRAMNEFLQSSRTNDILGAADDVIHDKFTPSSE